MTDYADRIGKDEGQLDAFRDFLDWCIENDAEGQAHRLLFIASGITAGGVIDHPGEVRDCEMSESPIRGVLDAFDLHYKARAHHTQQMASDRWRLYFEVSADEEHFETFQRNVVGEVPAHRHGEFFDYPEDAVEWFIEQEGSDQHPNVVFNERLNKHLDNGEIDERDLGFLGFVEWIPKPTVDSITHAINEGKHRAQYLRWFADEHDIDALDESIEAVFEWEKQIRIDD